MLVELRVGEQRYRAVWEVLDGASVTEVHVGSVCRGRVCIPGCDAMPPMVGWAVWVIGRRGRMAVRIR
jgi:hypothetical protein